MSDDTPLSALTVGQFRQLITEALEADRHAQRNEQGVNQPLLVTISRDTEDGQITKSMGGILDRLADRRHAPPSPQREAHGEE